MKNLILVFLCTITLFSQNVFAQHSMQIDDGAGHYGVLSAVGAGWSGQYTYQLPPNSGMLLTSGSLGSYGWKLGGNSGVGVNNQLGTTDNTDLLLVTGAGGPNTRMTISGTTGNIAIGGVPTSASLFIGSTSTTNNALLIQQNNVSATVPALNVTANTNVGGYAIQAIASGSSASETAAIFGQSTANINKVYGIHGEVSGNNIGGFSSGILGTVAYTGSNGIGVYGYHNGGGWGVHGFATSGSGIGVVGSSAGVSGVGVQGSGFYGIYGTSNIGNAGYFSITNSASTGTGVASSTNGLGRAGYFENSNANYTGATLFTQNFSNNGGYALQAVANGSHASNETSAIYGVASANTNKVYALHGEITGTTPNGFSSGVLGSVATSGSTGIGVYGYHSGGGWGVHGFSTTGNGVVGSSGGGAGIGVLGTGAYGVYGNSNSGYGIYGTSTTGNASYFNISNAASTGAAVAASTNGLGRAGYFENGNTNYTGAALYTQNFSNNGGYALQAVANGSHPTNETSAIYGQAIANTNKVYAVHGEITGTTPNGFSSGVLGSVANTGSAGIGVYGYHNGSGWAIHGYATSGTGVGVIGVSGGANGYGVFGNGYYGVYGTTTTGNGGYFSNTSSINPNSALYVTNVSNSASATIVNTSGSGVSQALFAQSLSNQDGTSSIHGFTNTAAASTSSRIVALWGEASSSNANSVATTGSRAQGNGTTTDANTNIALDVRGGEFVVARQASAAVNDNLAGNSLLAEDDADGAGGIQGPSGVVTLIGATAPAAGNNTLTTFVINNRYAKSNSIILLTPLSSMSTGNIGADESLTYFVTGRGAGTFTINVRRSRPTGSAAAGNTENFTFGFLVVNAAK